MKGIIAAVVLALPLAATALLPNPASAEIIIRPVIRTPARPPVVVEAPRRAERRVWGLGTGTTQTTSGIGYLVTTNIVGRDGW